MSRIYFHSQDGDAEVSGSERAHFGIFCCNVAWTVVSNVTDEFGDRKSILRNVFPPGHYTLSARNFSEAAALHFRVGTESLILEGKPIPMFPLVLNTAYSMGSDYVKLAARLHGQCEIHTYVEGKNRAWLSGIIRQGRECKFFRDNEGWESVVELLESRDDSPVVTSYSVCDQFPNGSAANFEYPELEDGELDWDAWYELSDQEQWDLGIAALRKSHGLEMMPDNWDAFYFGSGFCANKLVSRLYELYSDTRCEFSVRI